MKLTVPRLWLCLLFAVICLAAGSARAACTNPAGVETNMMYNGDYHTMQFCNGTAWVTMSGGGGAGVGPFTLISTQTASASASLQFTNLPTSYNTLFINCSGLNISTSGEGFYLRIGEGAGPTWKTGTNYTTQAGTSTAGDFCGFCGPLTTAADYSMQAYINNVGSSSLYKIFTATVAGQYDAPYDFLTGQIAGYWNADTNPVTGFEIQVSAGTITSGQCSLYGMN